MKNLLSLGLGLIAAASPFQAFAKQAQSPVDFQKLGVIAQILTQQTLQGENQVTYAMPSFDLDRSDLSKDRIVYSMTGDVKNTKWASDASLSGTTDYSIDRSSTHQGGVISFTTGIQTDVLGMLGFAATTAVSDAESLNENPAVHSALVKGSTLQTVSDLYFALVQSQQAAVNEIDRQIAAGYSNHVALQQTKTAFESISFAISADQSTVTMTVGNPTDLLATTGQYDLSRGKIESLTAVLTTTSIYTEGRIFVALDAAAISHLHNRYVKEFSDLINQDAQTTAFYQDTFRSALIAFKAVINMDNVR